MTSCSVESALGIGLAAAQGSNEESPTRRVCLLMDKAGQDSLIAELKWYKTLADNYQDKLWALVPDYTAVFAGTILEEICDTTGNMRYTHYFL